MEEGQLYTVKTIAEKLNFSQKTIRRRVDDNTIPHFYLWGHPRFDPTQIDRWLEKKSKGPKI